MEFEVRAVGGIEDCFVSLPLTLIQTLQQSTPSGLLPHLLALELRSLGSNGDSWFVAWSGATSSSAAIEVSHQFAECISLPSHTRVQVRVVSNMPKASLVTIEPLGEDDWEVLELNSEHAEASILKQVRVVHEGMRFPLWLHGRTIITFSVVSTFPAKAVVQLVPGAEVAVAPKRRVPKLHPGEDSSIISRQKDSHAHRALLRIQDPDQRFIHKSEVNGIELGIVLTSLAFIHPDTATRFSLENPAFVLVEPSSSKERKIRLKKGIVDKSISSGKESNNGILGDKNEARDAIVCLLTSDSVAKGHVMVSESLRIYLRAGLHSWVHVKRFNNLLNKNIPSACICPANFRMIRKNEKKGQEVLNNLSQSKKSSNLRSPIFMDVEDWSTHVEVVDLLSQGPNVREVGETASGSSIQRGLWSLLEAWFTAHLDVISSNSQGKINSFLLGTINLLHFEMKCRHISFPAKAYVSLNTSLSDRSKAPTQPLELLYMLCISDGPTLSQKVNAYQIAIDVTKGQPDSLGGIDILAEKVDCGDPVSLYCTNETASNNEITVDLSSLSWMQTSGLDVVNRMMVLLSPASGKWFSTYDLPLPGHVLIHGPPGSGKTLLAGAVARTLENNQEILSHTIFVRCSLFAQEKSSAIRHKISSLLTEALSHAPSVVVFDDLDSIIQSSLESEGSQFSSSTVELMEFLSGILDEYGEKRKLACGIGPLAFVATVQSLNKIPQSLMSSGRFDFHVQLPAPAASERREILKHEIERRSLQCPQEILQDVALKCDGYDAYDLEILVDRAIHSSIGRSEPSQSSAEKKFSLKKDDFSRAMHEFLPVAMRDITKSTPEGGRSGWDDVGGLSDIRNAIKEMIELPSKFPNVFAKSPLRLRSNVLLYGPPGCGKTHIVGAAAAACSMRFISVKGPELLNKYIGASEQAVRDIFAKATSAAPCLLFFDEFDSIAPKRGHDNTGVTDRVVNQFLTELDGVEVLTGVFVFAATSRPDLLDSALLRPGRLDRLLFCDFPTKLERLDILKVLSRKLPLAEDVDLNSIASMTEGFSGADLQALLSDAQLAAVHDLLDCGEGSTSGKMPVVTDALLKSVASKARASVSDSEKDRLYSIYRQFLDAKKSTAAQSREAKGKRATLA